MTGRFVSYRGGPPSRRQQLPLTGSTLAVVLEAETLALLDLHLGDLDDRALLPGLWPVANLNGP